MDRIPVAVLKFSLGIAIFALSLPSAAVAAPIPIATSFADGLIINFDFSSATPAPPYSLVNVTGQYSGLDLGTSTLTIGYFRGLDGTDLAESAKVQSPATNTFGFVEIAAPFTDGQFSIGLFLNAGTADLDFATAEAFLNGELVRINGVVASPPSTAVPEPASLLLLGTGLLGAGVRRYRHLR